jgi:hypothetical protein
VVSNFGLARTITWLLNLLELGVQQQGTKPSGTPLILDAA